MAHVVWFTHDGESGATVEVRFQSQDGGRERRTAKLDHRTARMLDRMCEQFLRHRSECARRGFDGTYFHAAHYVPGNRYLMRSFWSPRYDSIDARFVDVVEALRDYALFPDDLRSLKWLRIQDSAGRLEDALGSD